MKKTVLLLLLITSFAFSQEIKIQEEPIYSDGIITINHNQNLDAYYFIFKNEDYKTITDLKGIAFKDKNQLLNFMNTMIEIFEKPLEKGDKINVNMNDYVIKYNSNNVSLLRGMDYKPDSKKAKKFDSIYIFVDKGYTSVKRETVNRIIESINSNN